MTRFRVEYYDDEHRTLLAKYPVAAKLDKMTAEGLEVPEQEFLAYTLFREQKARTGWQTYRELASKLPARLSAFQDYFTLTDGTVNSVFSDPNDTDVAMTEAAGVGASLALASALFDLTEADWEKIPVTQAKDLDFQVASTGHDFVEVEAKGTVVDEASDKSKIYAKAKHIEQKKAQQRGAHHNKNILLGVIAAFPARKGEDAICRILDPNGEEIGITPQKYKLLARLSYYFRELRIISRAHILIALANRLQAITLLSDYDGLNRQPLLNIDNEPFDFPPSLRLSQSIAGNLAFGEVIRLTDGRFYFYGFLNEIVTLLINQRFADILNYRSTARSFLDRVNVLARVTPREAESLGIGRRGTIRGEGRLIEVPMRGNLSVTSSGRVIGPCTVGA